MATLSDDEVDAATKALEGWKPANGALRRSVTFPSFLDGIDMVRRVAELADRADHHPDIDIRGRTINFALSTHSEGGITEKDIDLAAQIDRLLAGP